MGRRIQCFLSLLGYLLLLVALMLCANRAHAADAKPVATFAEAVKWLEKKSPEMVRASQRKMKNGVTAFPPQAGPGYEAFWLRDYVYALHGCDNELTEKELRDACQLFIDGLDKNGAGVDCIKFDGTLIYQPGYGTMGKNPVADGSLFTVELAWMTHQKLKDEKFLAQIIERVVKAIEGAPRNPQTGLVYIDPAGYDRCPYGFTDSVRKQGEELFCSLLLVQANRELGELMTVLGRTADAKKYAADAEKLTEKIRETFWDDKTGLFYAATKQCHQPDIWGSAFAVYIGVATKEQSATIAKYFKEHYSELVQKGQLRHLPGGMYWESACAKNTYQNGGYWATPIGWFIYTLDLADAKLAEQTLVDMVNDFQARGVNEWVFDNGTYTANYLSSATLPLAGARAMIKRRSGK